MYCYIHTTEYNRKKGCSLWYEEGIEHLAANECLPAEDHPRYNEACRLRKPEEIQKRKSKHARDTEIIEDSISTQTKTN
jgi:hypothetical protein